jgi:hypothetical protein
MFLVPLLGFESPSTVAYLVLLVLIPLAVAGLIAFLGIAPSWRRSLDAATPSSEVVRKEA